MACSVHMQRIREIIATKPSKIAICENLDTRKFSTNGSCLHCNLIKHETTFYLGIVIVIHMYMYIYGESHWESHGDSHAYGESHGESYDVILTVCV